jgi:2,3-bisphosphoglycerate-independent phosphoglycerate mutase
LTCHKHDELYEPWEKVLERNYMHNITDEFIPPTQLCAEGIIGNGDGVIFCNVRPDRARELTRCFVESNDAVNRVPFILKPLILTFFITPTEYDVSLSTTVLFPRQSIHNTLKDILAAHDKTIFTIAETEKYAHVTYFLRGENEDPVATETRVMIPSLRVHDYREYPQMSAPTITAKILHSLRTNPYDFYVINYANADMVGHSGDFDATVKAVECLDIQLHELYKEIVEKMNGTLYITADHGKAEQMYDEKMGQPFTGHTNNKVPFIMLKKQVDHVQLPLPLDQLADIAPFILQGMSLAVPARDD